MLAQMLHQPPLLSTRAYRAKSSFLRGNSRFFPFRKSSNETLVARVPFLERACSNTVHSRHRPLREAFPFPTAAEARSRYIKAPTMASSDPSSTTESKMSPARTLSPPTKPEVLLLGTIDYAGAEWKALAGVATLRQLNGGDRTSFLAALDAGEYDGVAAIYRTFFSAAFTGNFDAELVARLPRSVRSVSHNGAGYDQVDVAACSQRGIAVSHTPQAVDDSSANWAMWLMLGAMRRVWVPLKALQDGKFRGSMEVGHDPQGKVLGILGMGGIGGALAKRAAAFGMTVRYCNRSPLPAEKNPTGAKFVDLETLLTESDVISVHLPLGEKTKHFIGKPQFDKMKDGVIFINTSRGPIIDEDALADAIDDGKVWSAGLDVFEEEPKINPRLLGNDKVILTPHISTSTVETFTAMERLTVANVRSMIETGKLVTQVPEQRKKEMHI